MIIIDANPTNGFSNIVASGTVSDKDQSDAAQRAQHARPWRDTFQERPDNRAQPGDDTAHETGTYAHLPGQHRVLCGPVNRPDHAKQVDEHHRRRDAVWHRGNVPALFFGDPLGQPGIDDHAGQNGHRCAGYDPAENDLGRHLEYELADARQDNQIDQVVGEKAPRNALKSLRAK